MPSDGDQKRCGGKPSQEVWQGLWHTCTKCGQNWNSTGSVRQGETCEQTLTYKIPNGGFGPSASWAGYNAPEGPGWYTGWLGNTLRYRKVE